MMLPIRGYCRYDDKHMWTHEDFEDEDATAEEGQAMRRNPERVTQNTSI